MTGQLRTVGGDSPEMCGICRAAEAAGPCAECRTPVCGDCCVLTEGGVKLWAVCLRCEKRGGNSLQSRWWTLIGWVVGPIVVLGVIVVLMYWLGR